MVFRKFCEIKIIAHKPKINHMRVQKIRIQIIE